MNKIKPTLVQGTRDYGPEMMHKRNLIIHTIKDVFEKYAFQPLETPAMERLDTLTGKYGEEGDRLIFRILNSGDFKKEVDPQTWNQAESSALAALICEKALRYDLTVPFARYVAMNMYSLALPFKRYQIQPVWRADRPQKGRFREFYQCDADVVGSSSLWQEVELLLIYTEVFQKLNIPVTIRINNRKLLNALAAKAGAGERFATFVIILDKLDKIGKEEVIKEWLNAGFSPEGIDALSRWIFDENPNLEQVREALARDEEGIQELEFILKHLRSISAAAPVRFDPTLARGLDYYTGTVFEVVVQGVEVGSVGGGGRYNDLTGIFGVDGIPGVGISFGLDRILIAMEELGLFDGQLPLKSTVLVTALSEDQMPDAAKIATQLRNAGVSTELYPGGARLKKSLAYAHKTSIPFAVIIGENEAKKHTVLLKNMHSGDQIEVQTEQLIARKDDFFQLKK
ncbi:histidine--tRNA ligase [Schleiferia thermophila]|uniref:Histidine--tRNA ligase n=1 Tax=Schleiferia thermophila TaxID=884107 RepID=A0A369AAG3_9FLAO|nr:histidine--tRNA ligase [Schleiferia thermophila]RCX05077.1 histidyl-tRNA synthetase [Schleiferia thermophila]GCD79405.1 histidine--tRNA ligase [Schleiferia thermophila]